MEPESQPAIFIPHDTFTAARKVYNLQHIYLQIGDRLNEIRLRVNLALLDPSAGSSPDTVFRLALVTAFQFAELLPDPDASEATLRRMDWKYALYLPHKHPGIPAAALCRYRSNLLSHPRSLGQFAVLLECMGELGLFSREASSTLNPLEAIDTVCDVTRLSRLNQAMRSALSLLVTDAPDWLRANARPHWYDRYKTGKFNQNTSLSVENREEEAVRLGKDMEYLLNALRKQGMSELMDQAEIRDIGHLLKSEFIVTGEIMYWKTAACSNCTLNDISPIHANIPP